MPCRSNPCSTSTARDTREWQTVQRLGLSCPRPRGLHLLSHRPQQKRHILKQFLGETFSGVVGCDYAGEYRRFTAETDARLQFCSAHLIRDVKFLTTLSDAVTCRWQQALGQDQGAVSPLASAENQPAGALAAARAVCPAGDSPDRTTGHCGSKRKTSPNVSGTTARTTSPCGRGRAWNRPTTASSRSSAR